MITTNSAPQQINKIDDDSGGSDGSNDSSGDDDDDDDSVCVFECVWRG